MMRGALCPPSSSLLNKFFIISSCSTAKCYFGGADYFGAAVYLGGTVYFGGTSPSLLTLGNSLPVLPDTHPI